jgi:hypothetical protein
MSLKPTRYGHGVQYLAFIAVDDEKTTVYIRTFLLAKLRTNTLQGVLILAKFKDSAG